MSNTKTTIELNGKRYDALTGRLADGGSKPASKPASVAHTGTNLDGFTSKRSPKTITQHPVKKASVPRSAGIKTAPHHKPQQAKTLMRHIVKKPAILGVPAAQSKTTRPQVARPDKVIDARVKRANHVAKSPLVSRFGGFGISPTFSKKVVKLPVQPSPDQKITSPITASQATFGKALETATSHRQPKIHKQSIRHKTAKRLGVSSKVISISAALVVAIILGGFIAYQNVPNVAMKVASTRAGFAAAMPAYVPSGFALNGKIQASSGKVTINFKSNSDSRSFAVTQEPSNWNSQSLLENYVAINNQPYQTYEDKGRTIYIYNGTSATWVNGGVWYQVSGNSNLNSDQLINIANSL